MVLYGLILGVLGLIIGGILRMSDSGSSTEYISKGNGFDYSAQVTSFGPGGLAVLAVGGIVLMIAAAVIASAYNSGLLRIADGQQTEIGSFFKPRNAGAVVAISVIVGVVSEVINLVLVYFMPIVGSLLSGLINIAIGIFVAFAVVACVDRNLGPIDAIRTSVDLVKANFGPVLLVLVVAWLLMLVGVILCFLGLLVTAPLAGLMIVYTYRRLSGGVVAPLTP